MSVMNTLATVRAARGLAPLPDPGVIQGFEPGAPPAPEYVPPDVFGINSNPELEPAPSPLIPRRTQAAVPVDWDAIAKPAENVPKFDLIVCDRLASWRGREVPLSEADERKIRSVVLLAIQREVVADLKAAGVQRVRRATKPAGAAASTLPTVLHPEGEAVTVGQPRKRGRPRKEAQA